jgi:hypothetical protein
MKNLLILNLKQGFLSKRFLLIVLCAVLINIYHVYFSVIKNLSSQVYSQELMILPLKWIGFESIGSFLFLMMPLIAVIAYSDSYFLERKTGFLHGIYTRISKRMYLVTKYIAVFIVGGVSFILPLLLNLFIVGIMLPVGPIANLSTGLFTVAPGDMLYDLYFASPIGYITLYLFIDFLFAGVFAVIALTVSVFVKNIFVVLLAPFLLNVILGITLSGTIPQIIPSFLVDPSQPIRNNNPIFFVIEFFVLLFITLFFYFWGVKKYEQV